MQYIPALRYLWLFGNVCPETGAELSDYRAHMIYLCRNLMGTNRCPGLAELDGQPIYMDERVWCYEKFSKLKEDQLYRFRLSVIDYYGHHQMRGQMFLETVTHLRLPKMKLSEVDLAKMQNLEVEFIELY